MEDFTFDSPTIRTSTRKGKMPLTLNPETQARLDAFSPGTVDAKQWADLWAEIFKQNPDAAADPEYLLTIFSNAMMAAIDECRRQQAAIEAQGKRTQLAVRLYRATQKGSSCG